jgi:hypothetical protein
MYLEAMILIFTLKTSDSCSIAAARVDAQITVALDARDLSVIKFIPKRCKAVVVKGIANQLKSIELTASFSVRERLIYNVLALEKITGRKFFADVKLCGEPVNDPAISNSYSPEADQGNGWPIYWLWMSRNKYQIASPCVQEEVIRKWQAYAKLIHKLKI